jgi:hypothetical protein
MIFRNLKIGLENFVQFWGYLDEWGSRAKGMGRFLGISSLFRNFSLRGKVVLHHSVYTAWVAISLFSVMCAVHVR